MSEERPMGHPSPPPPFRGRNNSSSAAGNGNNFRSFNTRPLTRSSRAEEIPDIYWEQAARELDFCTCRKCQVSTKIVVTFFLRLRNEFQPFSTKNQAASDSLPYTAFFHVLRRSDALFDKSKIWLSRSIHVISKFCEIEASRRRTLHP